MLLSSPTLKDIVMDVRSPADHVGLLALMISGVLIERLDELGQLDEATARHLHHLIGAVRKHADLSGNQDLDALFDRIDSKIRSNLKGR
jgi:hypothetical protein